MRDNLHAITKATFVYGDRGNVPSYMTLGGANYRLVTDHLGSVRMVVNASTGAIAQEMDYDEFGMVTRNTNPGFQPFGFAGGLYDAQTGLVRFGARDYDSVLGRWTAKDPILFAGGQGNLYVYCGGDGVNWVDFSGLNSATDWANCNALPGTYLSAETNTTAILGGVLTFVAGSALAITTVTFAPLILASAGAYLTVWGLRNMSYGRNTGVPFIRYNVKSVQFLPEGYWGNEPQKSQGEFPKGNYCPVK